MNKVALYDTECYPNFWLLKFRPIREQSVSFSIREGERLSDQQMAEIRSLYQTYTAVSFNGINYDVPMITAALMGFDPDQLKTVNDMLIKYDVKYWKLGFPMFKLADHIDLIEVAPGAGSLKQYAGRIHSKKIQDLPYEPDKILSESEIAEVELYCENDLDVLEDLWNALQPQVEQRVELSKRYGIDLRSKSDAQLAETVLKSRCESALGHKIHKLNIDCNMTFKYDVPPFVSYVSNHLKDVLEKVKGAVFKLSDAGTVVMPEQLEGLKVSIGKSIYRLGIGGLHSSEECVAHRSDDDYIIEDSDVSSYYPQLIINSGKYPEALGESFLQEYAAIAGERLECKKTLQRLKKEGVASGDEYRKAKVGNEGGKIFSNGTFGKTGSPYSDLFAPVMLIHITITGQLCLLMLIEQLEDAGIDVISANTDGIVVKCPRNKTQVKQKVICEWQKLTGLEMETVEYKSIYSRDVNNYVAVKTDGSVKRKGEYSISGLVEKKNPDVEICSDAVADYLAKGTPMIYTLSACSDIRKFFTIQKVTGGGIKLWGEGPSKNCKVRDMQLVLLSSGWIKDGREWQKGGETHDVKTAYALCFETQRPEYLGKVVRWYYSTKAPGPIVYAKRNAIVSLSYGARPCMTLPDEFPGDVDYGWYLDKCISILKDIGYYEHG